MSNQLVDSQLLFEKSHLQHGMHVADFGCGRTGHIVYPAAKLVGKEGMVYAVDIMKDVLEAIYKGAQMNTQVNIHTVWSDIEQPGMTAIPEQSLDVAFLISILDQTKKQEVLLAEVKRLLKEKARLVIVDWIKKPPAFGPPETSFVNFTELKKWAGANAFVVQEEFPVGPYHWGLVLYKHE